VSSSGFSLKSALVRNNDGRRPALAGGHKITFEPAWIEIAVQRGDQKRDINVGGDDLSADATCRPAREHSPARKKRVDHRIGGIRHATDRKPVAHDWMVAGGCIKREAAAQPTGGFALPCHQPP
jgi:hypothetical protein